MQVFLHVFRYQFCWNLLKHVKLTVKSERLFEIVMYNRTSVFNKKNFWRAYQWELKEDPITQDHEEDPITEGSQEFQDP